LAWALRPQISIQEIDALEEKALRRLRTVYQMTFAVRLLRYQRAERLFR
jgi:hypothetical protein